LRAALGIVGCALFDDPALKIISISIGGAGIFACLPVFWTLPTAFLSGASAAAGIAVVNAIGNLAGFAGPYVMGALKDATGTYTAGLLTVAGAALVAAGIVLALHHDQKLELAPEGQPAE
jgi:ACS family tartrate transporter-like MFS transporter